jgi:hypothetical protein
MWSLRSTTKRRLWASWGEVEIFKGGWFPSLRRFDTAWDLNRLDSKRVVASILSHSGHKYNILDLHLTCLIQTKRCFPFAQCRQRRDHPVVNRIGTCK